MCCSSGGVPEKGGWSPSDWAGCRLGARARVGLGWGLFLWNYLNGQGRQPTVEDVAPNAKILAGQTAVAAVDYFVWTRFFGLTGGALYTVMVIFDLCPLVAQAYFVRYLVATTARAAPAAAKGPSCCEVEARRLEKEKMLV